MGNGSGLPVLVSAAGNVTVPFLKYDALPLEAGQLAPPASGEQQHDQVIAGYLVLQRPQRAPEFRHVGIGQDPRPSALLVHLQFDRIGPIPEHAEDGTQDPHGVVGRRLAVALLAERGIARRDF
jgi:hypothetical protein